MSHKILVMSPLHQNGATVVSTMIAQTAAYVGKTSSLIYTQHDSLLPTYLGVDVEEDPTMTIMQVVKLIDSNAIEDKDIIDYMIPFSKNTYMMNITDPTLSEAESVSVVNHVYKHVPTDVVVCDNSDDLGSPQTEALMDTSDLIVLVIQPNLKNLKHIKSWLTSDILKDKQPYVVLNYYDDVVTSVRNYSRLLGIPAGRLFKVHYSPFIAKCCNNGHLHEIVPCIKNMDARVLNMSADIKEFEMGIISSLLMSRRGGDI